MRPGDGPRWLLVCAVVAVLAGSATAAPTHSSFSDSKTVRVTVTVSRTTVSRTAPVQPAHRHSDR